MENASVHSTAYSQHINKAEPAKLVFAQTFITLTQAEHVQLKWDANYWQGQYKQVKRKNTVLKRELESALARIRDLKQRLYGKKTEKGSSKEGFLQKRKSYR